jgi:hypothetical protein
MEQKVTDKEKILLSEEASIREDIINLFEGRKADIRSYRSFLDKWRPLSERLDKVISELLELESRRFSGGNSRG